MIIIPEVKLKQILDYYLDLIRSDYVQNQSNETESYLYKIFGTTETGNYNFFKQAKAILIKTKDDSKKLETRLIYDRSRAHTPTIHITIPTDQPFGDGLGLDVGYEDISFDDESGTYTEQHTRTFNTNFSLMVTSSNDFEVLTIHYLLKSLIISIAKILDVNGLRKPSIKSGELMLNQDTTPLVYNRALMLSCMYEFSVPTLTPTAFANIVNFDEYVLDINQSISTGQADNKISYIYANYNIISQ